MLRQSIVFALLLVPASAAAQNAGVFGSAGINVEKRDDANAWRPKPIGAMGVFINRVIGVEVSTEIGDRHDFNYTYSYSSTLNTKRTGTHRDALVLGGVRLRPRCSVACVELVASVGIAVHDTSSLITAECPTFPTVQPCTSTNKVAWNTGERARAYSFGVDVPIGAKRSRLKVAPSFRLSYIGHGGDKHFSGSHEPGFRQKWFVSFGGLIAIR